MLNRKGLAAVGIAVMLATTVAGCSSLKDQGNSPEPTPSMSQPQVAAPLMADITTTPLLNVTLTEGEGTPTVVVLTDGTGEDPTKWAAKFDKEGIVTFTPGSTDGSATFNPSLTVVAAGDTTLTLTNVKSGTKVVMKIHVAPAMNPVDDMQKQAGETMKFAKTLIGLVSDDAKKLAEKNNMVYRIVMVDGQGLAVTADYSPQRIDVTLEGGKIIDVSVG